MKILYWCVVGLHFAFMLAVGGPVLHAPRGRSVADYFVSGRNLPW